MSCLLVVDDEPSNLEIITEFLSDHEVLTAQNGMVAWQLLQATPERFDVVILDRMMPRMDGMELLRLIKADSRFEFLPVIMQTAASEPNQVAEGLAAGAWYYLAKPIGETELISIVNAALSDQQGRRELAKLSREMNGALNLAQSAMFHFRSPRESNLLATYLARLCRDEALVAMGLSELMLNAVEHGNLCISYIEKSRLLEAGTWQEEIDRRLASPEQAGRWIELEFSRKQKSLSFTIRDKGDGFEWQEFLEMNPNRAFDSHGRGIAMARMLAFPSIQYNDSGNTVTVTAASRDAALKS